MMQKLVAGLLVLAAVFSVQVNAAGAQDSRSSIALSEDERQGVLREMRLFLQSVQQIVAGISNDDMQQVMTAARLSGRKAQAAVPKTLAAKLPDEFRQLGFDTHARFDQLAMDADQLGDRDHALSQLNSILHNCVACHAAFRFE